jgi:hypothetical protein
MMGGPIDWLPMEKEGVTGERLLAEFNKYPGFSGADSLQGKINVLQRLRDLFPEQTSILNKAIKELMKSPGVEGKAGGATPAPVSHPGSGTWV